MFREAKVTTALETEMQPDGSSVITIDAYNGCQIKCPYCFQMNNEEWLRNIQIRTNIAEVLKEELDNLETDTELYIGSLSDPYMDIERDYELTRSILKVLKDYNFKVYITTKAVNGLILRDLELFKTFKVKPEILIGLSEMNEASKSSLHKNIEIANMLYAEEIPTKVFITPVLPFIMNVDEMIEAVNSNIEIYIDKLRVFDGGNQNIKTYGWIKNHYPEYEEEYYKILFESDEKYYCDLVQKYKNDSRITFLTQEWNN